MFNEFLARSTPKTASEESEQPPESMQGLGVKV